VSKQVASHSAWGFYGRQYELEELHAILARQRWFFVQITGRRRIGKTSLIQRALERAGISRSLYIQIPDSDPAGVVSACNDYLETFGVPDRVHSLRDFAGLIGRLVRQGYVVAIDEFQYFNRKALFDFCSLLQAEVDRLAAKAAEVKGGLIVLGSLHAEMSALLDDRAAPLFNRTTDVLPLGHLDCASLAELLSMHADTAPERLLFLWNLFEGVPKFYRDAYERGVLAADRRDLLKAMFFSSSSPLRGEADNWFLRELRGRYDTLLQYVARHPGCSNADIVEALSSSSAREGKQASSYLRNLTDRYRMVERRLPILAKRQQRAGRYYIADNFLRSWLQALQRPVSALHFRPEEQLVAQADEALAQAEGHALEDLAGSLYEEASRCSAAEFPLSERIRGYWDQNEVEIDLVAVSETTRRIRFGTCKRKADKLLSSIAPLRKSAEVFLRHHRRFRDWTVEYCAIAPSIPEEVRSKLEDGGVMPQSLSDLLGALRQASAVRSQKHERRTS
jgi:AAA+ ATPase superfamily predicted ATPase